MKGLRLMFMKIHKNEILVYFSEKVKISPNNYQFGQAISYAKISSFKIFPIAIEFVPCDCCIRFNNNLELVHLFFKDINVKKSLFSTNLNGGFTLLSGCTTYLRIRN